MARYSRRTGPAVAFLLPLVATQIPDLIITRLFDNGEVLATFTVAINNLAASARNPFIRFRLDGISQSNPTVQYTIPAGGFFTFVATTLIALTRGIHTLSLEGTGITDLTQEVRANLGTFTAIQLPLWDQDTDLL